MQCRYAIAPKGYLLVVEINKLFCSMLDGCRFGLEDSTVVFHSEGVHCIGFCTSVGYNKIICYPFTRHTQMCLQDNLT